MTRTTEVDPTAWRGATVITSTPRVSKRLCAREMMQHSRDQRVDRGVGGLGDYGDAALPGRCRGDRTNRNRAHSRGAISAHERRVSLGRRSRREGDQVDATAVDQRAELRSNLGSGTERYIAIMSTRAPAAAKPFRSTSRESSAVAYNTRAPRILGSVRNASSSPSATNRVGVTSGTTPFASSARPVAGR